MQKINTNCENFKIRFIFGKGKQTLLRAVSLTLPQDAMIQSQNTVSKEYKSLTLKENF